GGFFFDTIRVWPEDAVAVVERARAAGYNLYLAPDGAVQITCDETTTDDDVAAVAAAIAGVPPSSVPMTPSSPLEHPDGAIEPGDSLPPELLRTSEFLTHPLFRRNPTETAMLRSLRRLADFDITPARPPIPLGPCTLKLNP